MKKVWFSAAELAEEALPGLPSSKRGVTKFAAKEHWDQSDKARKREGRGGGLEHHYSLLPKEAQAVLMRKYMPAAANDTQPVVVKRQKSGETLGGAAAWAWYDTLQASIKDRAVERLDVLTRIEMLRRRVGKGAAVKAIAEEKGIAAATIYGWQERVRGLSRGDWLPALAPCKRGGGGQEADISADVWEFVRSDYLSQSKPSFGSVYDRLRRACVENGWELPNKRTLQRWIERKVPETAKVLGREGAEALAKLYPAQKRDRSMFHALEAVNADGHKWDVLCHLEDGTVFRPVTLAFQDLYSGKFVGWRHGLGENKDMVRLAFGDMCMSFGIPVDCYLDNGKAFASKWLTGGIKNRYRFKVKAEEPLGILTQLGVRVHWTTPYHGQSKPIERGFGDFARSISTGPWFVGAYTGNSPVTKPANYGTRTIPFEEFKRIVDAEIMAHNARPDRTSDVCAGKLSFNQAFDASYAKVKQLIRMPNAEQLRICLLAAEGVKALTRDGSINLMDNRYWHEALVSERGNMLTVRFDPDNLHTDLPVYRRDGTLICVARLIEAVGFADSAAARDHAKARSAFVRASREHLAAEKKLTAKELVNLLPKSGGVMPAPKPIAARPAVIDNLARDIANEDEAENEFFESLQRGLRLVSDQPKGPLDE